jgi:molybdenum cofactor synthesis domain-containing protein
MATAAIILIGNELLSGKIEDENGNYLVRRLRGLGVDLRRLIIVPDTIEVISDEIRRCCSAFDYVFSSGGVGPTHDDVTLAAIANAFEVELVRNDELGAIITKHFVDRLTDDHLRMADLPEGATLLRGGEISWPVICVQNLYIFPGVPELFRIKFEAIAERFRSGIFHLRSVYLDTDEGSIAGLLRQLEVDFGVSVGSYPRLARGDYRVRVTIEAQSVPPVNQAVEKLVSELKTSAVVRLDLPISDGHPPDKHIP